MKRFIVTFLYLGYVPLAPGTAASLATALLAWLYFTRWTSPWPAACLAASMFFAGLGLGRWAIAHFRSNDPPQFVLDEAAGQLVAALAAAPVFALPWPTWAIVSVAFVLFRLLDIFKPPPIRQAEYLPAALGIMADDILAGATAAALLIAAGAAWHAAYA